MSPIIVLDNNDNVRLILGASGGSKIITSVAQVAIKNLWMNKNIKDAIDERRVHHQLYPTNEVEIEEGFSQFIQRISFETPVSPPARAGEEEQKMPRNINIC